MTASSNAVGSRGAPFLRFRRCSWRTNMVKTTSATTSSVAMLDVDPASCSRTDACSNSSSAVVDSIAPPISVNCWWTIVDSRNIGSAQRRSAPSEY